MLGSPGGQRIQAPYSELLVEFRDLPPHASLAPRRATEGEIAQELLDPSGGLEADHRDARSGGLAEPPVTLRPLPRGETEEEVAVGREPGD